MQRAIQKASGLLYYTDLKTGLRGETVMRDALLPIEVDWAAVKIESFQRSHDM